MPTGHITLAHGNGGHYMRELISEVFAHHLANPELDIDADAALINLPPGKVLFTTDGFIVQPLEFPGGDIGSLAVHGTCNDLAVCGADPLYLTLNAFIEEGMSFELLDRLVKSIAITAKECGVKVVAGDTKVLPKGDASGVYFATSGIGICQPEISVKMSNIQLGDHILVSGPVGDHGVAVMLAREAFGMRGDLKSDAASVLPFTRAIRRHSGLRFMRDPTRGGVVTVCHEIAQATGFQINIDGPSIPVQEPVEAVCEILGYDPLYLACEGRVVAVVAPSAATEILNLWKDLANGEKAADIGSISQGAARVQMKTELGGTRILEELEDDPLPRIC
jgi:hydrogenase expression/formation protein HypE